MDASACERRVGGGGHGCVCGVQAPGELLLPVGQRPLPRRDWHFFATFNCRWLLACMQWGESLWLVACAGLRASARLVVSHMHVLAALCRVGHAPLPVVRRVLPDFPPAPRPPSLCLATPTPAPAPDLPLPPSPPAQGLIPRASVLIRLGGGLFLAFLPFMLVFSALFSGVYFVSAVQLYSGALQQAPSTHHTALLLMLPLHAHAAGAAAAAVCV